MPGLDFMDDDLIDSFGVPPSATPEPVSEPEPLIASEPVIASEPDTVISDLRAKMHDMSPADITAAYGRAQRDYDRKYRLTRLMGDNADASGEVVQAKYAVDEIRKELRSRGVTNLPGMLA